ncbi:MAG: hypothetical protein [Microviridae sp.]|nr:MAG: hypothetical protein [Microviridae sp.]
MSRQSFCPGSENVNQIPPKKDDLMKTKISKELFEHLKTLSTAMLDERGRELLNPIPHQPTGIRPKSESLKSQIQRMVKSHLSLQAHEQGHETFDEANDFDINTEFDFEEPMTPYEFMDEQLQEFNSMSFSPNPDSAGEDEPGESSPEEPDQPEAESEGV